MTLSEARAQLPALADSVSVTGEPVVVTRRGRPIVKLVRCDTSDLERVLHPLRGLPLWMADDFDAPIDAGWDALLP
jgi:prevent-host-death family protein